MIRYHGGPITPNDAADKAWRDGHACISFAHPQQIELAMEVAGEVMFDNGAYPIWRSGKGRIDVDAYRAWIEHWRKHPAFGWCVIPDVIDGDEAANKKLIETWPLSESISVPVWHMHESLEFLNWLVSRFPRVAIGSSGQYAETCTAKWWSRDSEAMEVACDSGGYPRTKLHQLRGMDPEIFSVTPRSSVDSCGLGRNIGFDKKWDKGPYVIRSKDVRAMVYRANMASHAVSRRWPGGGIQRNLELLG